MSYVNVKAAAAGLAAVCGLCLLLQVYGGERDSRVDDEAVQVRSMDVVLELHRDNRVTVTERLQAIILGSRSSGLQRTLNLSPRTPVRMAEAPRLRVLEASIDGSPCPADDLQAHFGTQDVTVPCGAGTGGCRPACTPSGWSTR